MGIFRFIWSLSRLYTSVIAMKLSLTRGIGYVFLSEELLSTWSEAIFSKWSSICPFSKTAPWIYRFRVSFKIFHSLFFVLTIGSPICGYLYQRLYEHLDKVHFILAHEKEV